jgi:hypothetical protein
VAFGKWDQDVQGNWARYCGAMERNDVPSRAQNKLLAKLAPMQRDIVNK